MLILARKLLNRLSSPPDTSWRWTQSVRKRKLTDGTVDNGYLMRRRRDGVWEYRRETPEEAEQRFSDRAW